MSHWVRLVDENNEICHVETHAEGGTYVIGGTNEARLYITYNYSEFFYEELDEEKGLRWLYGKQGEECVTRLEKAVGKLGIKRDADYWNPTKGNAGFALSILLGWAKEYPNAKFEGD